MCGGRSIALAGLLLIAPATVRAQDLPARFEAGGQVGALELRSQPRLGAGVWFDINIARPLAFEARATSVANSSPFSGVHTALGVRATFVRTPRASFFGVALPGWYHVTLSGVPDAANVFALDLGAGVTFAVSSRLSARVELDRIIIAFPGFTPVGVPGPLPGLVGSNWDLHAGVSYTFGPTVGRPQNPASAAGRWTIGPQVGYTITSEAFGFAAVGAFVSYRLLPYLDADGSVSTFITSEQPPEEHEGGRLTQAVAGVKVGVREGRVGVFFKLRVGVNSFSSAQPEAPRAARRLTVPALDLGGVFEVNVSPAMFVRGDVGEGLSFIHIDPQSLVFPGIIVVHDFTSPLYTLPMRVGFGWRF